MKNLLFSGLLSALFILAFQHIAHGQGDCATSQFGDLNAQNLSYSPSSPKACGKASVTAEWLQQAQRPYDPAEHLSVLIVSLPAQFLGTTGTFSITATGGGTYWNPANITVTDNEIQVPLEGIIPSSVQISITISDMDVVAVGTAFSSPFNVSQSVSNVTADCDPSNDEQSINGIIDNFPTPIVTDIQPACVDENLAINLTVEKGGTIGGTMFSFSWTGPNGFTSTLEDPSFTVAAEDKEAYTGKYYVTVTDENGCIAEDSIALDGANCFALPIELLSFTASARDNNVDLDWKTATELNNSHFEVQRSADGRNFESIGRVAGNGTTSEVIAYSFTDQEPYSGQNFYRLKQADYDGLYEYSPVRLVSFNQNSALKVYPNPAPVGSEIYIHGQKIRTVQIYNMLGQLVVDRIYDQPLSSVIISSSNLAQGIYTTRVNGVDEKRVVIK